MICNRCKGFGVLVRKSDNYWNTKLSTNKLKRCPKCQGTKTLDWIEMIVGKKEVLYDN